MQLLARRWKEKHSINLFQKWQVFCVALQTRIFRAQARMSQWDYTLHKVAYHKRFHDAYIYFQTLCTGYFSRANIGAILVQRTKQLIIWVKNDQYMSKTCRTKLPQGHQGQSPMSTPMSTPVSVSTFNPIMPRRLWSFIIKFKGLVAAKKDLNNLTHLLSWLVQLIIILLCIMSLNANKQKLIIY